MTEKLRFQMPFEPMTIEHLGLRLYSTLSPVISELVSNAYDAESPKVEVILPAGEITTSSEVVVRDYGHGLSPDEVQSDFLPIGRNRRGADSQNVMSKNGKVRVTGRKGLGKLSGLGVAGEMEVRAIREGFATCIVLNYEAMQSWAKHHPGKPFEPQVLAGRTGPTADGDGVEIKLRLLKRTRAINADLVRKGLAKRLRFIGKTFEVNVNGVGIKPGDRVQRKDCPDGFSWNVEDLPNGGAVVREGLTVTGWIGFLDKSSQADRGVDVFASSKAVELGSFFNYASTHVQFARAHLVGEIHAQFLDAETDLAATARNSVVWESEYGQLLQNWGQAALRWAFDRWAELRKTRKQETIIKVAEFDKWLASRQPREQRVAQRMVKLLVDDDHIELSSAQGILEIIKTSVETQAFHDLVDTIEREGNSPQTLLRLFDEWRVIEAREHLLLADGRTEAIAKLNYFIENGGLEVQDLQPLLTENIWLLDPGWVEANVQPTYTKMLRENCTEPKGLDDKDRRLDILGVKASGSLVVVELKRPEKVLSRDDLEQIEKYVDWARTKIATGSGGDAPRAVTGLLLVGQLSKEAHVTKKIERLEGHGIFVETYRDLYVRATEYYTEIDNRLQKLAPEYSRAKRKKRS